MNTKTRTKTHRRLLGALGLATTVALIAVSPALADRGRDRGRDWHRGHAPRYEHGTCCDVDERGDHRRHRGRGHAYGRRARESRFAVPDHIHRHEREAYRAYDRRRVYDPIHRHHHVVYLFPVVTRHGLAHRWFPYCNGVRYRDGSGGYVTLRTPRFSFGVNF